MDLFVFNIEWADDELNTPKVTEWTLYDVKDVNDIDGLLFEEFGCHPNCFEYYEL